MTNPQTEKLGERIDNIVYSSPRLSGYTLTDKILKACKEGIEIEGITYRLKFVPSEWELPHKLIHQEMVEAINSQIKEIELE